MNLFDYIVWSGAGITLVGLVLLVWCIVRVMRAKNTGVSDDDMRTMLQSLVPLNLGALLLSALGLMIVVTGLILN